MNKYDPTLYWHPDYEKCGFILKTGEVVTVENCHPEPANNFEISQADLEKYAPLASAFWHSHTHDCPNLSVADYKAFLKFPDHEHVIFCYESYAVYYVRNDLVYRKADGNYFGVSS